MRTSVRRWFLAFAGVMAAVLGSAALGGGTVAAHAMTVLCVNPHGSGCYHSIQVAINNAPAGARINVAAGIYY